MEALIKGGADVNARLNKHLWFMSYNFDLLGVNSEGATPFWRAAYGLDIPAMKLLLANGADPKVATKKPAGRLRGDDAPPAEGAVPKDESGLPPIPVGGPGVFPIHAASGVGYGEGYAANSHRHAPDAWIPAVKYLIEAVGADVNARDHNGFTVAPRGGTRRQRPDRIPHVQGCRHHRRGQTRPDGGRHGQRSGAAHPPVRRDGGAAREARIEELEQVQVLLR
jgi:hypothetical protein